MKTKLTKEEMEAKERRLVNEEGHALIPDGVKTLEYRWVAPKGEPCKAGWYLIGVDLTPGRRTK